MSIAPEPIFQAGTDTVSWACMFCRSQTLRAGAEIRMLDDAMQAIREVPRMLLDWEHHDLAQIRSQLGSFPTSRWPDAPDFVAYFDQRLRECGHHEDAG